MVSFSLLKHYRLHLPLRCPRRGEAEGPGNFMGKQVDPVMTEGEKKKKPILTGIPTYLYRNPTRAILRIAVKHVCGAVGLL